MATESISRLEGAALAMSPVPAVGFDQHLLQHTVRLFGQCPIDRVSDREVRELVVRDRAALDAVLADVFSTLC